MKKINKKTIIVAVIIIFIIGGYYLFTKEKDYLENSQEIQIENYDKENEIERVESSKKIVIYIAGAVKNEGIYELDENSRISDCIENAGGLVEGANIKNINLAYVVEDGMKIYIPNYSEENEVKDETNLYVSKENESTTVSTSASTSDNTNKSKSKININTANQTELETLPGIGASTAKKIIEYRKEKGKFSSIQDIKKVNGIGESKYSKIKDYITV